MNVHAIDSALYKDLYGDNEIRECFSDENLLKQWLAVEVALAKAQAELGIIPESAYEEINKKADIRNFDMTEIRIGIKDTSHPLISFIRMFEDNCEDGLGEFVHFGATTQDIMDTGLILQLKQGYNFIYKQLEELTSVLKIKTKEYRSVPMAGRTHGQHALPITLGFKLATWLSEINRHRDRLDEVYDRVFVGQLGGAVGTLASLNKDGIKVQKRVMEILDLQTPDITWHSSRDNIVELASVYAKIAGTIGKIANEFINLQRTEISELGEGFVNGKVGSSTMPHKRNPMICEYVVGLSRLVRLQMPVVYDVLVQEHERDMGLWLVEWEVWPEISIYTSKMITEITEVLKNMTVNRENMVDNLNLTGGLIVSEHMMFVLAPFVGKQTAHDIVYEVCMNAYEKKVNLAEEFYNHKIVKEHLTKTDIEKALQPDQYLGLSEDFTDVVLNAVKIKK